MAARKKDAPVTGFGAILDHYADKYGTGSVRLASEAPALFIRRLRTGIFALDYALGGGLPLGRWTSFWGRRSSGKSTTAMRVISVAQRTCIHCLEGEALCKCGKKRQVFRCGMVDQEGTYDPRYGAALGVDNDAMLITQPETGEQGCDAVEAFLRTGVDMTVVDSLANFTPASEVEADAEKPQMASQARLVNRCIRKITAAQNAPGLDEVRRPTAILINQVRQSIGPMSYEVKPGGYQQDFNASCEVKFKQGQWTTRGGMPTIMEVKFRTEKNKTFCPKLEGRFPLLLREWDGRPIGDTMEDDALAKQAATVNLVPGKIAERQFDSVEEFQAEMRKNPAFLEIIRKTLLGVVLGGSLPALGVEAKDDAGEDEGEDA